MGSHGYPRSRSFLWYIQSRMGCIMYILSMMLPVRTDTAIPKPDMLTNLLDIVQTIMLTTQQRQRQRRLRRCEQQQQQRQWRQRAQEPTHRCVFYYFHYCILYIFTEYMLVYERRRVQRRQTPPLCIHTSVCNWKPEWNTTRKRNGGMQRP
jgi:hypothetical protein